MSEYDEGLFGFEKLDVYQRAVELLAVAARVIEGLPRWPASDCTHYAIARGSAMECAAILNACRILGFADASLLRQGRALLIRVVSMLTRMCSP